MIQMNSVASITPVGVFVWPLNASLSLFKGRTKEGRTKWTCRPACLYLAAGKNFWKQKTHSVQFSLDFYSTLISSCFYPYPLHMTAPWMWYDMTCIPGKHIYPLLWGEGPPSADKRLLFPLSRNHLSGRMNIFWHKRALKWLLVWIQNMGSYCQGIAPIRLLVRKLIAYTHCRRPGPR